MCKLILSYTNIYREVKLNIILTPFQIQQILHYD